MSYDYDALVNEFVTHRQAAAAAAAAADASSSTASEHLSKAVDALETLSDHCPMTPLLWVQYAAAMRDCLLSMAPDDIAVARQAHRQTLAVGLTEFPGSLLLHARHAQVCLDDKENNITLAYDALAEAVDQVGRGSYRQHPLVPWLYRQRADATYIVHEKINEPRDVAETPWYDIFLIQATAPLGQANDELKHTIQTWTEDHATQGQNKEVPPKIWQSVEDTRRRTAKVYGTTSAHEDEIQALLSQGGLLDAPHLIWMEEGDQIDWTGVDFPQGQTFGMGLGDTVLGRAFSSYAGSCWHHKKKPQEALPENEADTEQKAMETYKENVLPWSIYERAVAECPTVESLWLSYLQDIQKCGSPTQLQKLPNLVQRACRNCPYSIALVKKDLEITQQLLREGILEELEPDILLERVIASWDRKFLPGGAATWCDLTLQVISVVREHLLSLVFPSFDAEDKKKIADPKTPTWNDETREEVEDLLSDIVEMYDLLVKQVFEKFSNYAPGRSRILQERALVEYHLIRPLEKLLIEENDQQANCQDPPDEALEALATAAKVHPHPDIYLSWIRYWQYNKQRPSNHANVVKTLTEIRCAFVQAWHQASAKAIGRRDFATALAALAHEWIEWEALFGSSQSLKRANLAIQRKYHKMKEYEQKQERKNHRDKKQDARTKRPSAEQSEEPATKKFKIEESALKANEAVSAPEPMELDEKEAGKRVPSTTTVQALGPPDSAETPDATIEETESKKQGPKVVINGLEYPAHPYTVRVSNLAPDVEDMDLVDLFRPKAGGIVHARIVREKGHGKTKSKGWALVQFEEVDSVEKALALSGEVGLHERLLTVARSSAPAVMLVPPGMHRVNARGEGKSSKRNERKKKADHTLDSGTSDTKKTSDAAPHFVEATQSDVTAPKTETAAPSRSPNILSLAPRGVRKKGTRPKPKI